MAKSGSTSEALTPELLASLRPYASAAEMATLEAELARQQSAAASSSQSRTIAKTRAEAAKILGVRVGAISDWMTDPTFPGKAGDRGRENGYFPIEEIQAWRSAHRRPLPTAVPDGSLSRLRQRKLAADTRLREVKLRTITGDLVAASDARAVIVDAVNAARSQLEAWPSKIAEQVSASRPKLRRWLLKMATKEVRKILRQLEDSIQAKADDSD